MLTRRALSEPRFVLGDAALGSFSPHLERTGGHLRSHQLDHVARGKTKLSSNRVEAGAILPGHHDDSVNFATCQHVFLTIDQASF